MRKESEKFLPLFTMFIIIAVIFADFLANDIMKFNIHGYTILVNKGMITFPLTFFLFDFITELYHYKTTQRIITFVLIGILFSCFIAKLALILPSSSEIIRKDAYQQILPNFIRANIAVVVAGAFAYNFNGLFLQKLRDLMKGKSLFYRLILTTTIAEFFYSLIWAFVDLGGTLTLSQIYQIAGVNLLIKVLFQIVTYIPTRVIIGTVNRYDKLKHSY